MKKYTLKSLASAITSVMALLALSTQSVKAADTEIYQAPTKGNVTLMLVLDVSGSMHQCDTPTHTIPGGARVPWSTCQHNGQTLDSRFSLVKKAMQDLLRGNPAKNIDALDDDKIIGLATLGAGGYTGEVLIPARPLGSKTDQNSHRYVLLRRIENLQANSWTPTAYSYAEVASYLMGTTTKNTSDAFSRAPRPSNYHWQISGFNRSETNTKTPDRLKYNPPKSLEQPESSKHCHGQGIYMLTDGEPNHGRMAETIMKESLGNKANIFSCGIPTGNNNPDYETGWACIHKYAKTLLDPTQNPKGLKFKTAVVGFGRTFTTVLKKPYDPKKTKDDNIKALGTINNDAKRAAEWGIIGEGGWYAGSKSQDVVDSVNHFIASLTESIPNVATGQPFIPIDPLDPLTRMSDAYYGSFIPKINANNSFWLGDMNKYQVKSQLLYGKNNAKLFNATTGLVNPNVIGFWNDNNKNGMTALLPLRANARPVFTNHTSSSNAALTKVTLDALFDGSGALVNDTANRNAWLNLLGYDVPLNGTPVASKTAPELSNSPELRQAGAVMHSTPIVLTQSGTPLNATSREDYVLFGSTQGVLHVVDSETGVEKVAFVPKEMMTNQKQSFQNVDATTSGLLWGIDGPWTAYTQYVPSTSGFSVLDPDISKRSVSGSDDLSGKGIQWVYGGLRMGGRSYYALDLSDIDNPKIKFHIDPASAPAGSPLSFMGQSWSKPTLGFVNWEGDYFNPTTNTTERAVKRRLVMFVGGGYDMGYETRTYNQTNGTGGGVYMFDAHNGELLWWGSSHANTSTTAKYTNNANLKYSVVSNISTFDRNNDGLVDNLIFGDLGGQVFRVDLDNSGSATPTNRVVRLYNGHQAGGLSPRFYESPSLSAHKQDGVAGTFGVISVASGNRSSPLAEGAESAKDMLVVLYDHDVLKGIATTDAPTDNLTDFTGKDMNVASNEVKATAGVQGWKYYLSATAGKLKGYGSPRVVDNFLFLTTYTPDGGTVQQNSCNAGIVGDSYQEIFCMPGGVCTTKQQSLLGGTNANITPNGSQYRTQIGVGIVQAAVGTKDASGASSNENRIVAPKVDCTVDPNNPACMTEVSSITNKPTRWYEKESRN